MKRILMILLIGMFLLSFASATTWGSSTVLNATQQYYKFDETSGTNALESMFAKYNGTLSSSSTWKTFGKINGGILTSSGYANLGVNAFNYSKTKPFTISMWINTSYNSAQQYIFWKVDQDSLCSGSPCYIGPQSSIDTNGDIQIILNSNWNTADQIAAQTTGGGYNDGKWKHLLITYDGSGLNTGINIYINGTLVAQTRAGTLGGDFHTNQPVYIGTRNGGTNSFQGMIDEVGLFNRSVTSTEITALYNTHSGRSYPFYYSYVVLNSPASGTTLTNGTITFNATAYATGGTMKNMSLWTNETGTWALRNVTTSLSGSSSTQIWARVLPNATSITWAVQACDTDNACGFSDNRTLTITTAPLTTIIYPTSSIFFGYAGQNISLNYSVAGTADSCWMIYRGVTSYIPCTANSTFILGKEKTITLYTNNSLNDISSTTQTWDYDLFINNNTYSNNVFETDYITNSINITYQSSKYTSISANLSFNGTYYSSTSTGSGNDLIFSKSFDVPTGSGQKNIFWTFALTNTTGTINQNSNAYNQTVDGLNLGICSATNPIAFMNFTFKDESDSSSINASTDLATFVYYLGSGGVTKTLLFQNTTENPKYDFCLNASSRTLYSSINYQYSSTGYPQRTSTLATSTYTNTSTNIILYLLGSGDGQYVSFQVTDSSTTSTIQGATVTATRDILGIPTVVAEGTTDDSGLVTFWLNPNYPHTLTYGKTGCSTTSSSITPTQTQYTLYMSCTASNNATTYQYPAQGVLWQYYPATGTLSPGNITFSYVVWSVANNVSITKAKMELISSNGTIVASNETTVAQGLPRCTSASCSMSIRYNFNNTSLKGKFYVDVGGGYMLIEGDAHWISIAPKNETFTLVRALQDMLNWFNNWTTSDSPTQDDINKMEYSRIVFLFLIGAILLAILGRFGGYEAAQPGAFLVVIAAMITILSVINGVNGQGFFYFNNLVPPTWIAAEFINNYIFTFTVWCMTIGTILMYIRRNSQ